MTTKTTDATPVAGKPLGMRKNGLLYYNPILKLSTSVTNSANKSGHQWIPKKKAFRPTSGLTSYAQRTKDRLAYSAMKAKEKEMKDEKESERQVGPSNRRLDSPT